LSLDPKYSASAVLTGLSGGTLILDGISSTLAATLAPFYQGDPGADGADGVGVPVGGTSGQVLAKASATDYDTEWVDQSGGGGGFASPTIPAFTDVTGAAQDTLIESNTVVVAGDADTVWPAVVRGDGSPEVQVNAGAWGPSGIFRVGDSLKLRATSAATTATTRNVILYAQGVTAGWAITTVASVIPANAIRDRAGDPILDRAGNIIESRV
jgi:hypothetical protein